MPISGIPFLNVTNTSKEIQIVDATQPRLSLYVGTNVAGGLSATSTGSLVFETSSGIERARILSTGQFGIGTTTPGAKLEVFNSGGTVFNVLGSLGQLFSVTDNLSGEIFAVADISGVPIMSINSNGSIKFGSYSGTNQTGTPTYILGTTATGGVVKVLGADIPGVPGGSGTLNTVPLWTPNGDTLGDSMISQATTSNVVMKAAGNNFILNLDPDNNAIGDTSTVIFNDRARVGWFNSAVYLGDGGANKDIKLQTNLGDIISLTSNTERMRIKFDTGNVGIGLTDPTSKLTVGNGNIELSDVGFSNIPEIKSTGFSGGGRYVTGAVKFDEKGNFNGEIQFWTTPTSSGYVNANAAHAQRMVIAQDGNVGIGTVSPTGKLTVSDDGGTGLEITPQDASTRISLLAYDRTDSAYRELNFDGYNYSFRTSGNVKAVMLNNGNVGIGNTSPFSLLEVGLPTSTTQTMLTISSMYTATPPALNFRSGHPSNSNVWNMGQIRVDDDGNYNGVMEFLTTTSGGNSGAEPTIKMVIKASGNVGIGTVGPNDILHVSKTGAATRLRVGNNGAHDASIYFNTSTDWSIGTDTSNSNALTFGNSSAIGTGTKVVITTGGNVGIGNTVPTYRLVLGGNGSLDDSIKIGTYLVVKDTRQYIGYTRADTGLFESSGNGDTASTVLPGVAGIRISNTAGTVVSSQADNSVQLLTHVYNAGSRVTLHADANGRVGIGTTTPSAVLSVVGTANFTGLASGITPVASNNFVTKAYVDGTGSLIGFLPLSGGTMSGDIQMGANNVKFDQSGTRSWNINASSGNLNITSGDSGGLVFLSPGISVEDNAFIGGYATITGNLTVTGTSFLDGAVTIDNNLNVTSSGVIRMAGAEVISAARFVSSSKATSTSATIGTDNNATLTTKGYVDGLVTGVPVYKGTWDARNVAEGGTTDGGTPDLRLAANKVLGNYYIVSTAGSASPNGGTTEPNSWNVGDWCIFSDVTPGTGTDLWQKIDNTSVISGAGTGQSVTKWEGTLGADSETLTDGPIIFSTNDSTFAGSITNAGGNFISNGGKIIMQSDGTLDWGNAADYGTLTWDTGYALIVGQSGKGLRFQVNNGFTALTLDTSKNATFEGDVIVKTALLSNQENTDVDTGTETIAEVAIATYTAAFFDFVVKKTTNVRSGTVYACHDGTNVQFTETSTQDLGNTSDVVLSVDISGGQMRLRATVASNDWSIKSLIRGI